MGTKKTIDAIGGAAITCSFAIPEIGPILAGGFALELAVFNLCYPKEKTNPDDLALSVGQFKAAMKDMKSFISGEVQDDIDTGDRHDRLASGMRDLTTCIGYLRDPASMTPLRPSMGGTYDETDIQNWKNLLHGGDGNGGFVTPLMSDDNPFLDTLDWLSLTTRNRQNNLEFSMYFINLYMNYVKLAVTWEFTIAVKEYAFLKAKYDADKKTYNMALKLWKFKKKKHPGTEGALPKLPVEPVLATSDYTNHSQYTKAMIDPVKGIQPYIKTVRDVITADGKNWNLRQENIKKAMTEYHVVSHERTGFLGIPTGTNYTYEGHFGIIHDDSNTFEDDRGAAVRAMNRAKADDKVSMFNSLGQDYNLTDLTLNDIQEYDGIVKTWEGSIENIKNPKPYVPPPPPPKPGPWHPIRGEGWALRHWTHQGGG